VFARAVGASAHPVSLQSLNEQIAGDLDGFSLARSPDPRSRLRHHARQHGAKRHSLDIRQPGRIGASGYPAGKPHDHRRSVHDGHRDVGRIRLRAPAAEKGRADLCHIAGHCGANRVHLRDPARRARPRSGRVRCGVRPRLFAGFGHRRGCRSPAANLWRRRNHRFASRRAHQSHARLRHADLWCRGRVQRHRHPGRGPGRAAIPDLFQIVRDFTHGPKHNHRGSAQAQGSTPSAWKAQPWAPGCPSSR